MSEPQDLAKLRAAFRTIPPAGVRVRHEASASRPTPAETWEVVTGTADEATRVQVLECLARDSSFLEEWELAIALHQESMPGLSQDLTDPTLDVARDHGQQLGGDSGFGGRRTWLAAAAAVLLAAIGTFWLARSPDREPVYRSNQTHRAIESRVPEDGRCVVSSPCTLRWSDPGAQTHSWELLVLRPDLRVTHRARPESAEYLLPAELTSRPGQFLWQVISISPTGDRTEGPTFQLDVVEDSSAP